MLFAVQIGICCGNPGKIYDEGTLKDLGKLVKVVFNGWAPPLGSPNTVFPVKSIFPPDTNVTVPARVGLDNVAYANELLVRNVARADKRLS